MATTWTIPASAMRPYDLVEVVGLTRPDPKSGTLHRFGLEPAVAKGAGVLSLEEVDAELSRLMGSMEGGAGSGSGRPEERLRRWDFNACAFAAAAKRAGMSPMILVGKFLVQRVYGLADGLGLDERKLGMFLAALEANYGDTNPYHNDTHAMDVLLSVHFFLQGGLGQLLAPLEVLALLVAALGHDTGHGGVNNNFLSSSGHGLVDLCAGFSSVLEHHHTRALFTILSQPDCNFVDGLSAEDLSTFRERVSSLILATDMSRHGQFVAAFKELLGKHGIPLTDMQGQALLPFAGKLSAEDRLLVASITIKASDLSNVVKPEQLAWEWGERIMSEFFHQGDLESKLGLKQMQPTTLEDKTTIRHLTSRHQLGFLENCVHGLYDVVTGALLDPASRKEVMMCSTANQQIWRDRAEQAQRELDAKSA